MIKNTIKQVRLGTAITIIVLPGS